ncbi:MAG: LLM class flavin-dependent oxidoreductase [Chloroflexi bacterium]|nr:LLM class flavin-dependent oxidoreductase [Chloroflexota bacterium]
MSTATKVRWGMAIPQVFVTGTVDMALVQDVVRRAEALGYDSLWVQDRPVSDYPIIEPITLLSYAAALTTRPRLGVSVLLTPLRDPPSLGKALASLDQMSGGRLIVGVGLGNVGKNYPQLGVPTNRRVRRFLDGLEVMKAIWTQPSVTHRGDFWKLEGLRMEPRPVQRPHPPIWFGGHHPDALRRAVHHADGWMGAGNSSTQEFQQHVQLLRQYLEETRRDPGTFAIAKRVYLAVDRNEARARRRLEEWFGTWYGNAAQAPAVGVLGSAQACVDQLARVVALGAQVIALNPVFDQREQLELLAREVLPHL